MVCCIWNSLTFSFAQTIDDAALIECGSDCADDAGKKYKDAEKKGEDGEKVAEEECEKCAEKCF